jgi:flavin-dependent dehydrogenase
LSDVDLRDDDKVVVHYEMDDAKGAVEAQFIIDATGQSALLANIWASASSTMISAS